MIASDSQLDLVTRAKKDAEILRAGAGEADRTRTFPTASLKVIRGYRSFMVPSGTTDPNGMVESAVATCELAKGDPSAALGLCMHHFAMGELGRAEVDPATRDHYWNLGRTEGFCALVSEPGTSNMAVTSFIPSDLKARKDADGSWTLKGTKHFATFFEISTYAMVFAHWENHPSNPSEVVCLIVPTNADGIEVVDFWQTHGMRATRSNRVNFHDVRMGEEAFVYSTNDYLHSALVEGGARLFSYMAVYQGIAERLLELSGISLSRRRAKGTPHVLGYDPVINGELGGCKTKLYTSGLALLHAMGMVDRDGGTPDTLQYLLMAKLSIGRSATEVATALTDLMGGRALLTSLSPNVEHDGEFEWLLRDVRTSSIMPPSSNVCRQELGYYVTGLDPMQARSFQ